MPEDASVCIWAHVCHWDRVCVLRLSTQMLQSTLFFWSGCFSVWRRHCKNGFSGTKGFSLIFEFPPAPAERGHRGFLFDIWFMLSEILPIAVKPVSEAFFSSIWCFSACSGAASNTAVCHFLIRCVNENSRMCVPFKYLWALCDPVTFLTYFWQSLIIQFANCVTTRIYQTVPHSMSAERLRLSGEHPGDTGYQTSDIIWIIGSSLFLRLWFFRFPSWLIQWQQVWHKPSSIPLLRWRFAVLCSSVCSRSVITRPEQINESGSLLISKMQNQQPQTTKTHLNAIKIDSWPPGAMKPIT